MEQVVKTYGKFMLEGFAIICLAGFLFWGITDEAGNKGVFEIIGANLPIAKEDYSSYADFKEIYQEECKKKAPQIMYVGEDLATGVHRLQDIIKATDYSGRALEITVMSIKGVDGRELIDDYDFETSEIDLSQAGVYVVTVSAIDDIRKSSQCTIKIPVNK